MRDSELECDVLVAGGGMAGVAAAASAARLGSRVVLLEANAFLGGMATASEVGTICGLYLRDANAPVPRLVAGGFLREFSALLISRTRTAPLLVQQGLWVLPCDGFSVSRVCDSLLHACGVEQVLRTTLCEASVQERRCRAVRAMAWNQPITIRAEAVVDCTGEATLAHLAGCPTYDGLGEQAPALVFTIDDLEGPLQQQQLLETRLRLRRAVESGELPPDCERLAMVPAPSGARQLRLKLNLPTAAPETPPWRQMTEWERHGRACVEAVHTFLSANVPAFRQSLISGVASQVGVRSGRRIMGRAELSDSHVMGAVKHPQGVARGSWPMERWSSEPRPAMAFFQESEYYEVSLDCLRTRELDNLWAAGRCFSAARGAMTSARVIGTAMATGWAAGAAAATQAKGQAPEASVPMVRAQMCQ